MPSRLPSVVIAGRPNVGKSTLFNRLTSSRRSIVTDEPGITRDRIYGKVTWEGRSFELVDTGGLVPDDKALIPREILRQAQVAIDSADLLVIVTDARAGLAPLDEELARLLRTSGKPLIIAANKVDDFKHESLTAPFYELGVPVFGVSAEHGFGVDVLLDYITEKLGIARGDSQEAGDDEALESAAPAKEDRPANAPVRIAIIGRPNVGKSTLLNQLAGEERSIVSPEPGTTRDTVDSTVIHGGKTYEFIDTAGIRRKGKTNLIAEKLSVIMARKSLERADVALLIVDASLGITSGDATISSYAAESGCSIIVVMNKWDLALEAARDMSEQVHARSSASHKIVAPVKSQRKHPESERARTLRALTDPALLMEEYERIVREKLKALAYAPVVFLSALTAGHADKLFPLIDKVAAARRHRITTGELNRWVSTVDLERGTSPTSRKIKIYYVTQASTSPPTFILFTNQDKRLHFSYERFLENRLRESFDFTGAPIRFLQRVKERDKNRFNRPRGRQKEKRR
ncbi:MAG TPA: ribosome biogenesis GTPase Der [Candidatus Acidoferrales bacterium]|nr:ribosome biogenesis GTPase Der [Candidatus Acidoferrales bacterium]